MIAQQAACCAAQPKGEAIKLWQVGESWLPARTPQRRTIAPQDKECRGNPAEPRRKQHTPTALDAGAQTTRSRLRLAAERRNAVPLGLRLRAKRRTWSDSLTPLRAIKAQPVQRCVTMAPAPVGRHWRASSQRRAKCAYSNPFPIGRSQKDSR